ncbi:hypothetical protein Tco_0466973, partial [Tanacetum coccineum]
MSGSPTPFPDPVITSPSSSITPFEDIASILEETFFFFEELLNEDKISSLPPKMFLYRDPFDKTSSENDKNMNFETKCLIDKPTISERNVFIPLLPGSDS